MYGLTASALKEVSAEPSKQPSRTDWYFTFADEAGYPLEEGEARIRVMLVGNEVADAFRFVHAPEECQRAERNRGTIPFVVQVLSTVAIVFLFVGGAVGAIVLWSRKRFAPGAILAMALAVVWFRWLSE